MEGYLISVMFWSICTLKHESNGSCWGFECRLIGRWKFLEFLERVMGTIPSCGQTTPSLLILK